MSGDTNLRRIILTRLLVKRRVGGLLRQLCVTAVMMCLLMIQPKVFAKGSYQDPEAFLVDVFGDNPPQMSRLWIKDELKQSIRGVMDHDLPVLRLGYWRDGDRSVWIVDEIGKEQPITIGVVVNAGQIERVKILAFRESRGWEIRYPFFTDQFKGAGLKDGDELDRTIDGISGATLSVNAVNKVARVALLLDRASKATAAEEQE